jgi:hypothetical protein
MPDKNAYILSLRFKIIITREKQKNQCNFMIKKVFIFDLTKMQRSNAFGARELVKTSITPERA